ncbi:MAG: response regulator [Bacteroidota bacterium]
MNNEIVKDQIISDILIVDDVPMNLKVLGDILKRQGYKVRPVPNGTLALQAAEKVAPDLILLDIMMPDMDGFEVCKRLKENDKLCEIPVIVISALNDTRDIVNALQSGAVDFITKPFRAEEVIARVRTHLKLYQQSKKLKEQSEELQKLNASKDKFFSIIAHDLRGPLGGFMGLSEILIDDSQLLSSEQKQKMSVVLSHSARNIYNLLENLLEWSQMQHSHTTCKLEKIDLKNLVIDCLKLLDESRRNKGINITMNINQNHELYADSNMIQSLVRNLLSNAIKFTPQDGNVIISASLSENNTSVITVKDDGIGMNKEMIATLFHIDSKSSRPGTAGEPSTGLGLMLCKDFVEKHGGELWVEGEEGNGSVFFFSIPDKRSLKCFDKDEMSKPSDEVADRIKDLKILIAEDNENSEFLVSVITSTISTQVLKAVTGTDAVEICRKNPDIDLVLMDIKMPEMNGLEATRQIRQFNKEVIIIAQTAFGLGGEREKAMKAGCNDYISKPIDKTKLLGLIQKHF